MNARSTLPFFLIAAIAACAACDRRETTGTSDVNREGQGNPPEIAQDLRETATPTPYQGPESERPIIIEPASEVPAAPPIRETAPAQDAQAPQDEGDTLGRP